MEEELKCGMKMQNIINDLLKFVLMKKKEKNVNGKMDEKNYENLENVKGKKMWNEDVE